VVEGGGHREDRTSGRMGGPDLLEAAGDGLVADGCSAHATERWRTGGGDEIQRMTMILTETAVETGPAGAGMGCWLTDSSQHRPFENSGPDGGWVLRGTEA
jgi:hypothetical protein